jgi:hypothetical protein
MVPDTQWMCAAFTLSGCPQGTGNYRAASQFKTHLKKSEGASEFSRSKTITQQRRSLPVFTVRDELMQVGGWVAAKEHWCAQSDETCRFSLLHG